MDPRLRPLSEPGLEPLFEMVVDLQPRTSFGDGPLGRRVLFAAAGGTFAGPRLRGAVLPNGGDWALFRPDGAMSLDVRLALRTEDGAFVHMTYGGRWVIPAAVRAEMAGADGGGDVDPARYYFRTTPLFETGAPAYAWLNDLVCVGTGYRVRDGVAYAVHAVT